MSIFSGRLAQLWGSWLGYDAVRDNQNRRPIIMRNYPQDSKLRELWRDRAIATTQDGLQNYVSLAWLVRRHLDFVAALQFKGRAEDDRVNDALESFMRWWGDRNNFDVRRRHGLMAAVRMAESRRTVDGDFGMLKIGGQGVDRGKTEPIESYRVDDPHVGTQQTRTENIEDANRWIHGIEVTRKGSVARYAVHDIDADGNKIFRRTVPPQNMAWLGYYDRFDQVRGISPILTALNAFADVAESETLFRVKQKIIASFGIAIYRDGNEGLQDINRADMDADGINEELPTKFLDDGSMFLDLQPNEKAEMLESATPASEAVNFMQFALHLAIKALDMPTSFLDESRTTFHGGTAAMQHYLRSVGWKQLGLIEWLDNLTKWRLGMAFADMENPPTGAAEQDRPPTLADFGLPPATLFSDLRWEWVPRRQPWWNPVQEATGAKMAVAAGFDNYERAAASNGTDIYDNLRINAKVQKFAQSLDPPQDVTSALASSTSAQFEPQPMTEDMIDE